MSVAAVRAADAKRVLFDRDQDIELHSAVAASCAVPGIMQPVRIGDCTFVDDGVVSCTNADVVIDGEVLQRLQLQRPEAVIVCSPMTGDSARSVLGEAARRLARQSLRRELFGLDDIPSAVLAPDGSLSETVLDDALSAADARSVLAPSFLGVGAALRFSQAS